MKKQGKSVGTYLGSEEMASKTAKGRKTRSAGRFGVRYGTRTRKLIADIEGRGHEPHRCPRCGQTSVSRQGTGIWGCRKCGYTFAGGAYIPHTPLNRMANRAIEKARSGDEDAAASIIAEAREGETFEEEQ